MNDWFYKMFICRINVRECFWKDMELYGKEALKDREELLLALDMRDLEDML